MSFFGLAAGKPPAYQMIGGRKAYKIRGRVPPQARVVWQWLHDNELLGDTFMYSRKAWIDRGETMGTDALFTITTEGEMYALFNYADSAWAYKKQDEFNELLKRLGLWYEQGYAWSFHFYNL
jgi:hypothetical protein